MNIDRIERLLFVIDEWTKKLDQKISAKMELNKCKRMINKLNALSDECEACKQHLHELENNLLQMNDKFATLDGQDFNQYQQIMKRISSHLQKTHKIYPSNYYLGIFMSLGISLGVVFGLVVFENVALGIPLGMILGIGIGKSLDADAKKKGLTL